MCVRVYTVFSFFVLKFANDNFKTKNKNDIYPDLCGVSGGHGFDRMHQYKQLTRIIELVVFFSISTLNSDNDLSEKERMRQEQLDVRCLQLLRAVIHNEIVKLPVDWPEDMKDNTR